MDFCENITPVILAGCLGTRLRPLISDLPKVLAPVNGKPFLTYLLDQVNATGFSQVVLCTGYKGEVVRQIIGDIYTGLTVRYSYEKEPLGTGGALRLAHHLVSTDNVLVMNGDSYVETDLAAYLSWQTGNRFKASILLTRVADAGRFGSVRVNQDNLITCFEEKKDDSSSGLINGGIYMINKSLLEMIPSGKRYSLEQEFFPALAGKCLYGYPCEARFIDIGNPESYSRAEKFLKDVIRIRSNYSNE